MWTDHRYNSWTWIGTIERYDGAVPVVVHEPSRLSYCKLQPAKFKCQASGACMQRYRRSVEDDRECEMQRADVDEGILAPHRQKRREYARAGEGGIAHYFVSEVCSPPVKKT